MEEKNKTRTQELKEHQEELERLMYMLQDMQEETLRGVYELVYKLFLKS